MGELLAEGAFGDVDTVGAVRFWKAAAAKGEPSAMYNLGLAYKNGTGGLPKDTVQAVRWLDAAANFEIANALSYLAAIYQRSDQIPHDPTRVIGYLKRGAMLGHENMQYRLAKSLFDGYGAAADIEDAYVWANLSARKGEPEPKRFTESLRKQLPSARVALLNAEADRREAEIKTYSETSLNALQDACWRP